MNAEGVFTMAESQFKSFAEFYPFYLSEHANTTARRLHFVGSCLALACFAFGLAKGIWWYFLVALIAGYAFAWIGHFFRSEEHTSELQSLMRISYAVFCLKKKRKTK